MGNVGTGTLLELTLTQNRLWEELPALRFWVQIHSKVLHCFQPTPVLAFGTSRAPHSLPNQYRCFNTHQNPDNYKQNRKTGQGCFLLIAWTLSCSQARCFPLSDIAFKDIFVGHIANTHFMIRGMSRTPNQNEDHTMPAGVIVTTEWNKCREDEYSSWENTSMGN